MPEGTRIIQIGDTHIVETADTLTLSSEELRQLLVGQYPEIAHASLRETPQADGTILLEFVPRPGHKG